MNDDDTASDHRLLTSIKHLWQMLTEDDIHAHDNARDLFFMAVRRKYGLARAHAEMIVRDMRNSLADAPA